MSNPTNSDAQAKATAYAAPLSAEFTTSVAEAVEATGFGFRQYDSVEALRNSVPGDASGCLILFATDISETVSVVRSLTTQFAAMPIIVLAKTATTSDTVELMRQGAYSVLTDPSGRDTLVQTIGNAVQRSSQTADVHHASRAASRRMAEATTKEIEVLQLIMRGLKNKEIANELGITVRAVEDRRFRLMRKVQVDSAAELVALAVTAQFHDQGISLSSIDGPDPFSEHVSCLKGIEVWTPAAHGGELTMTQSAYCDSASFRDASEGITFHRGEGLPGQVWEKRAPVFLKELIDSSFVRSGAASAAGITTAVGIPIFRSRKVIAVVVLLIDGRRNVTAAFESWRVDPQSELLTLNSGTYINCESLRRLSEFVHLPPGEGLAGICAGFARPCAMARFHDDAAVVRRAALAAEQLSSAVALPMTDSGSLMSDVLLLLNSETTPVFSFIEIWKNNGTGLKLATEIVDGVPTLTSQLSQVKASADSLQAACLQQNHPVITCNPDPSFVSRSNSASEPAAAIAIPTFIHGGLAAMTVLGTSAIR